MKKITTFYLLFLVLSFTSCKKEETKSCTICSSEQTANFEICKEPDGNASINGDNTGISYSIYIANLEEDGVICGN